jgi:hypothetical protein
LTEDWEGFGYTPRAHRIEKFCNVGPCQTGDEEKRKEKKKQN